MTTPALATTLASRLAEITLERASAEARRLATMAVVDAVGITLAGATEDATRIVRRVLGRQRGSGAAPILGSGARAGALDAAMITAPPRTRSIMTTWARNMGGYPSVPVVLTLGEELGATGARVLETFIERQRLFDRNGLPAYAVRE